jgi:hypothetical protein
MKTPLERYLRKQVIIHAGGIVYRGTLIEVSEEEILLKTKTGWVSVQVSQVSSIRGEGEEKEIRLPGNRFVDPSFYDADLEKEKKG